MFVKTPTDLASSVQAFMDAPEYWRSAIGNNPKYFLFVDSEKEPLFGLSKFCAFSEITLEDYVATERHKAGGGPTQQLISRICQQNWTPLAKCPTPTKRKFKKWFSSIVGNRINLDNISIISLDCAQLKPVTSKRALSPEALEEKLKRQNEIGKIGEEIAFEYEVQRLKSLGAKNAENLVTHEALKNSAAGFDISSSFAKETRYIEVKSTTQPDGNIYVSPNEINTLQKHGAFGYIYLVHVTDLEMKIGYVIKEISDPFPDGEADKTLMAVLYCTKKFKAL